MGDYSDGWDGLYMVRHAEGRDPVDSVLDFGQHADCPCSCIQTGNIPLGDVWNSRLLFFDTGNPFRFFDLINWRTNPEALES